MSNITIRVENYNTLRDALVAVFSRQSSVVSRQSSVVSRQPRLAPANSELKTEN
jgi:hypothetical protein